MRQILLLASIAFAAVCAGCTSSLVYDPSLGLPARPIAPGEAQLSAAGAYLLETRPDRAGETGEIGLSFAARGGFTSAVSVTFRHWVTAETLGDSSYSGGAGADMAIRLTSNDDLQLMLIPRSAILFAGSGSGVAIDGGAFGLQAAAVVPIFGDIHGFGAIGPVLGFRDLGAGQWGMGALVNGGLSVDSESGFGAGLELASVGYYNIYDEVGGFAISPSFRVTFRF